MSRWRWLLKRLSRRLWVRAGLIGLLGVATAILAAVVERYVTWQVPGAIAASAVGDILTIIASSMLAVTTFSLSIVTSAYRSATSNVTPRATPLIIEDKVTQNVLSAFIGSFLFSIVGLIVLKTGAYGERGRVILFVVTIGVVALIVVALVRWIDHLTHLGHVTETTSRIETVTREALEDRLRDPYLGGTPWLDGEVPGESVSVRSGAVGHVQHVDVVGLARLCEAHDIDVYVTELPGGFTYAGTPLALVLGRGDGPPDDSVLGNVLDAFALGPDRTFDQDPRFGLSVLSEVAQRALSPAVNDPGTALDVIARETRLLTLWSERRDVTVEPRHPHIHVPPLATADLFEDAFAPVGRDGAGLVEVQLRLQKSLLALSRLGDEAFRSAARRQSEIALERALSALTLEADCERLRAAVVSPDPSL